MQEPKKIKEILPDGWLPLLSQVCKTDRGYISGIVNDEKFTSKHWPAIEALALKHDPKAYHRRLEFIKSATTAAAA